MKKGKTIVAAVEQIHNLEQITNAYKYPKVVYLSGIYEGEVKE